MLVTVFYQLNPFFAQLLQLLYEIIRFYPAINSAATSPQPPTDLVIHLPIHRQHAQHHPLPLILFCYLSTQCPVQRIKGSQQGKALLQPVVSLEIRIANTGRFANGQRLSLRGSRNPNSVDYHWLRYSFMMTDMFIFPQKRGSTHEALRGSVVSGTPDSLLIVCIQVSRFFLR